MTRVSRRYRVGIAAVSFLGLLASGATAQSRAGAEFVMVLDACMTAMEQGSPEVFAGWDRQVIVDRNCTGCLGETVRFMPPGGEMPVIYDQRWAPGEPVTSSCIYARIDPDNVAETLNRPQPEPWEALSFMAAQVSLDRVFELRAPEMPGYGQWLSCPVEGFPFLLQVSFGPFPQGINAISYPEDEPPCAELVS